MMMKDGRANTISTDCKSDSRMEMVMDNEKAKITNKEWIATLPDDEAYEMMEFLVTKIDRAKAIELLNEQHIFGFGSKK